VGIGADPAYRFNALTEAADFVWIETRMAGLTEYRAGRQVKLMLKSKTVVEGIIFSIDPEGKRIVLEEIIPSDKQGLRDVRIVNLASVESATFGEEVPIEPLVELKDETALKREKAAFRAREEALLKAAPLHEIKDPHAKILHEMLSKTYKCVWNDKTKELEIQDVGVRIKAPYRSAADVAGSDARAVSRVAEIITKLHFPK
jgi:hypothetical protein